MTDLDSRIAALSPEQRARLESRIAGVLSARAGTSDLIPARDQSRPTPLSFAQQREWALERFRSANNVTGMMRLEGEVDLDILGRILTEISSRHEVLRSTVELVDGVPVQVVHPVTPVPVPLVDLSALDADEQRDEVRRHSDAEVRRPFPAEATQRLRCTVLRLGPTTYLALLTLHHAAADGWSCAIVLQETAALYRGLRTGTPVQLPPLPIQYGDFAAWQREHLGEEQLGRELGFWRETLDGIPPRLELPADRPYPGRRTYGGAIHGASLSPAATAALQRFAAQENVSISMVMLAVASVVLHR